MKIEVLFSEVCNLFGDAQNAEYLKKTLPDAEFIETALTDEPFFAAETPDIIYMGSMTENTQRRVIEKLLPLKARLEELIEGGTVMLFTGNAGETLMEKIAYVTEKKEAEGLGILPQTVKTDLFDRRNSKVLGRFEDMDIVGFQSRFSRVFGVTAEETFVQVTRGVGSDGEGKLEGVRRNNLFCTTLLGPVLPVNPLFTEYLLRLAGSDAPAAFRKEAMDAYEQRLKEFKDPNTKF